MGKDFYEKSPLSRTIFDQASEAVNLDLKKLCFEENDLLDKTEYTQVAMVTACLAMTRAVESMGLHADMTAGLSLGEYCAIAVAGGMCDLDATAQCVPEESYGACSTGRKRRNVRSTRNGCSGDRGCFKWPRGRFYCKLQLSGTDRYHR